VIKNPTVAFQTEGWIYIRVVGEFEDMQAAIEAAREDGDVTDHDYTVDYGHADLTDQDEDLK
jgi:hypothetical protein